MKRDRVLAGTGGIAFAALLLLAFIFANAPGGKYHASDVADFVAKGHRASVVVSIYLMGLAVAGLIVLMAYLCDTCFPAGRRSRIAWGSTLVAAASLISGWLIVLGPAASRMLGGGPTIDPGVAYTIMQAGFGVLLVASGLFLGFALLLLASGGASAPTWVRVISGIAGVLGLVSAEFFPFLALLVWGLVIGIWLLASSPKAASAS